MIRTITQMIVDGYRSGETDFLTRLGQADAQVRSEFQTEIIQPILAVLTSPNQTAVLTIAGHSDRVDTEGLTREQRRKQEFDASAARAESAAFGVRHLIANWFLSGGTILTPEDVDDLAQIAIVYRASGAAYLIEAGSSLSAAQRLRNRRVQLRVIRFTPG
jgi:flagellar motor protein MotB